MDDWNFFEDDILNAATYKKWRLLSVHELSGERVLILNRLDGAWANNPEVRSKLIKLLDKFDTYYDYRLNLYKQELEDFRDGETDKD